MSEIGRGCRSSERYSDVSELVVLGNHALRLRMVRCHAHLAVEHLAVYASKLGNLDTNPVNGSRLVQIAATATRSHTSLNPAQP